MITSPGASQGNTHRQVRSQFFGEDKNDFSDSKQTLQKMKDKYSEGSLARISALEETDPQNTFSWKRHSSTVSKNNVQTKKKKLKRLGTMEDEYSRPLTSEKCIKIEY